MAVKVIVSGPECRTPGADCSERGHKVWQSMPRKSNRWDGGTRNKVVLPLSKAITQGESGPEWSSKIGPPDAVQVSLGISVVRPGLRIGGMV
jgi:hypothetical protein